MARQPRNAVTAVIEAPTTAAIVQLSNPTFTDQDTIQMDMAVLFNGFSDNYSGTISFARNATTTVKNNAIRAEVNTLVAAIEGAGPLNNANIQIVGLPV